MDDNDHTRVSTSGGSDPEKPVTTVMHFERRMGRPVENEKINIIFGNQMLVGREKACEIFLPDDRISRKHALIRIDPDAVRLSDLGSTNGTSRNNAILSEEIILNNGDVIDFGKARKFEARIVDNEETITSVRLASGRAAFLLVPQEFVIGFADPTVSDVDLKIYDKKISSRHARIEYFAGRAFMISLDPDNPVVVNSNPVREIEIKNNYMIEIGDTLLRFERPE